MTISQTDNCKLIYQANEILISKIILLIKGWSKVLAYTPAKFIDINLNIHEY